MAGYNRFPEIAEVLHEELAEVVEKTCKELKKDIQAQAVVATGFMRDSTYTSTWNGGSTYGEGGYGDEKRSLLPEVDQAANDLEGKVAVGATYGAFVELGTIHQTPQPYFYPAVGAARIPFEQRLNEIDQKLQARVR